MATNYYYSRMLRRAWQDTKAFFGWNKKNLTFPSLFSVGLFIYWRWQGGEAVMEKIAEFIAFGLAPVGGFALLLFVWNLIRAPSRMEKDIAGKHKKEVDKVNTELQVSKQRLRLLEDERIPRMIAKPIVGRRQYEYEHEHLMWAGLEVTNKSQSLPLKDVEIQLVSCLEVIDINEGVDKQTRHHLYDRETWSPICVLWSEREVSPPTTKVEIAGGQTKTALVAYCDNSNGIWSIFNAPITTKPMIVYGAKIEIVVSSPNSASWARSYYIECHPNYAEGERAKFEFVEWEEWVTAHNINPSIADKEGSQNI